RPTRRRTARPVRRREDSRHQQDRRLDLEGERDSRRGESQSGIERPSRQNRLIFTEKSCIMSEAIADVPSRGGSVVVTPPAEPERKGLTKKELAADHPTWC